MKLRTKFFKVLLISNTLMVLILSTLFSMWISFKVLSLERKKLDLLSARFVCSFTKSIKSLDKSLDTILYSNDILLLLVEDDFLKRFISLKLKEYIEDIKKDFPYVEDIFISNNGRILYPDSMKNHSPPGKIFQNDGKTFLTHSIIADTGISLSAIINVSRFFGDFVRAEGIDENIWLIFEEAGKYLLVSTDGSSSKVQAPFEKLVLSSKRTFDDFLIFLSYSKDIIYSSIYGSILISSLFIGFAIIASYFISKYLSNHVSSSFTEISEKMRSFENRKFQVIEVNERYEDELKTFLEIYNTVSKELDKYVKNTEKIIEEKTRKIAQQNEILKRVSITDELTGLYNRRYFNQTFPKDHYLAFREKLYINLAIMDLDDFKRINDTYGHQAGDCVLKRFSNLLKKYFTRKSDKIVRFGGEEFIVYYLSKEKTDFFSILEKFRKKVETYRVLYNGESLKVTVSIGAVSRIPQSEDSKQILLEADKNLYIAKKMKKNVVVLEPSVRLE